MSCWLTPEEKRAMDRLGTVLFTEWAQRGWESVQSHVG